MKKHLKKLAVVTAFFLSCATPIAMASKSDESRSLVCSILPWMCMVDTMGAGGTDHGGPRPKKDGEGDVIGE